MAAPLPVEEYSLPSLKRRTPVWQKLGPTTLPLWTEEKTGIAPHYKPHKGSPLALPSKLPRQPLTLHLEAITLLGYDCLWLASLVEAFGNGISQWHFSTPVVAKNQFSHVTHIINCCHKPLYLVL